ncbi:hypothetical protein BJ508DRAFT_303705 [Ascobolus immersus RN42]|uniref:Uncharacterized protein n=1 Tax=Ascobolus immersus RN42 TaxID=1160509 RepID=A0A3N4IK92_ASCIM|nr:hypothetical protein BJ508DRAFT_303705 [Ascobolus immersus RN42]
MQDEEVKERKRSSVACLLQWDRGSPDDEATVRLWGITTYLYARRWVFLFNPGLALSRNQRRKTPVKQKVQWESDLRSVPAQQTPPTLVASNRSLAATQIRHLLDDKKARLEMPVPLLKLQRSEPQANYQDFIHTNVVTSTNSNQRLPSSCNEACDAVMDQASFTYSA